MLINVSKSTLCIGRYRIYPDAPVPNDLNEAEQKGIDRFKELGKLVEKQQVKQPAPQPQQVQPAPEQPQADKQVAEQNKKQAKKN